MATPAPQPRFSRRAAVAIYVGGSLLLASAYAAAFAASKVPLGMALRGAAAVVLPNALLGIASLRLAGRRLPAHAERPRLAAHLVVSVAILTLLATAGWIALIRLDAWIARIPPRMPSPSIVLFQLLFSALIQIALTGIGYAWHAAEVLQEARDLAARSEILRARAELQLLRSQLQPHFVNNVLHALLGLVRRDPAVAESALEKLGELLRFGQSVNQASGDWVPLSREWDFVRSYLELERLRLGDRLEVLLDADESALDVPIPPFALQPLVENAIIHGIAPRAAGGRVEVSVRRSGGRLRLVVADDGPGREGDVSASTRMGLRLLQERLAALYAGRARLSFESASGGGFQARLDLPDDAGMEPA